MPRTIRWRCAAGHDFEVETEWRQERCPVCGGTDLERIEEPSRIGKRLFGAGRPRESRWWR